MYSRMSIWQYIFWNVQQNVYLAIHVLECTAEQLVSILRGEQLGDSSVVWGSVAPLYNIGPNFSAPPTVDISYVHSRGVEKFDM